MDSDTIIVIIVLTFLISIPIVREIRSKNIEGNVEKNNKSE
jgi:hypothetical protein